MSSRLILFSFHNSYVFCFLFASDLSIVIGTTNVGTGATGVCNINGSLKRIDVIETGFDYITTPKVTITGGQGTGAEAQCNVSNLTHNINFNAGAE